MFCLTAARDGQTKPLGQDSVPTPYYGASLAGRAGLKMSKSEKRQRTVLFLGIRWFPEEKEQVCESARAAGLSAGEFVRRCTLGRRIVAKGDTRQMNEILKQGGLLKHLYSEMKKDGLMTMERSKEFSDALVAMQVAFLKFDASSLNNSGE